MSGWDGVRAFKPRTRGGAHAKKNIQRRSPGRAKNPHTHKVVKRYNHHIDSPEFKLWLTWEKTNRAIDLQNSARMRNSSGIALLTQLREALARPWFKTVVVPILLVYFVLRPVLRFLFPSGAANSVHSGKGAVGTASGSSSEKSPQTTKDFLKQQLELVRKQQAAQGAAGQSGGTHRRGRAPSGSTSLLEVPLPLPPVASADGQLSPQRAQALRNRLHVDANSVVTIAVPASAFGTGTGTACATTATTSTSTSTSTHPTGLHELLRTLAGHMHVFVLVRLQPVEVEAEEQKKEGGGDAAAALLEQRRKVEHSLLSLTTGQAPVLPQQRVLYSQSVTGRTAAVRQLRSTIHVDFDHDVCRTLEQHVRTIVYIKLNEAAAAAAAGGVHGFSEGGILMLRSYAQLHELQL